VRIPGSTSLSATVSALYIGLYVGFYPPTFSILDEQAYLSYGLLLTRGEVFADGTDVQPARTLEVDGRLAPRTPLGTPLLLAPAIALDWRASFAVTLLLHLIGAAACAATLRKLALPPVYALLYLLHPVASLYARTVMSDVPTMTFSMLGVHAALSPRARPFLAGLAFGALPHFRFAQAITPFVVALVWGAQDLHASLAARRPCFSRSAWLVAGIAPGLASSLALNTWLYGGPLTLPLTFGLSAANLPANLAHYLITQNVVYPGLLIVGALGAWPLRIEARLIAVGMLLLYGAFPFVYQGFGPAAWLIGDRFFLPLVPWLLPPYVAALERVVSRAVRARAMALACGVAVLLAAYAVLGWAHDRQLRRQERIQQTLYRGTTEDALVVLNPDAREYLFAGIGRRRSVSSTALFPAFHDFDPSLPERIERAIPEAYLFVTERLDRDESGAESGRALVSYARERYELDEIAGIESWPDRVRLYRIRALRAGSTALASLR
jgi:hypothetical protein